MRPFRGFWVEERPASLAVLLVLLTLLGRVQGFAEAATRIPMEVEREAENVSPSASREPLSRLSPSPNDDGPLFSLVDLHIANRKLDEAEKLLQDHLGKAPNCAGTLYRLGRVYFDRHDWSRSAEYLLRSLRIELRNDRAHLILGLDYVQLNRLVDAERELLLAVEQNPQSDENQYMAGRLFFTKSKVDDAIYFFYQALRLNPTHYKAHHSLGLCFTNIGSYALAESYYKKAIELADAQGVNFAQGYLDLAELLTGIEAPRAAEGEVFARQAAELSGGSSQAHYLVGKALYRQGKHTQALPELIEAARLDPNHSRPHYLLAKIYLKMGRKAEAKNAWETFEHLLKPKPNRSETALEPSHETTR